MFGVDGSVVVVRAEWTMMMIKDAATVARTFVPAALSELRIALIMATFFVSCSSLLLKCTCRTSHT